MTQKFVTVYLDNGAYGKGKVLVGSYADKHGPVEEHLQPYLDDGWRIASVTGFGGNSESLGARGWFAVVMER